MILANEEAQTRPYQHYVTVCLSVPPTKQFWEAPVVMVQWFVCLSVAMATVGVKPYLPPYCFVSPPSP